MKQTVKVMAAVITSPFRSFHPPRCCAPRSQVHPAPQGRMLLFETLEGKTCVFLSGDCSWKHSQCYGDLWLAICSASGPVSFLLTATQPPSHDTSSSSALKGTLVIAAAWSGSPETLPRVVRIGGFMICLFQRATSKLSSRSSQATRSHIPKYQHSS